MRAANDIVLIQDISDEKYDMKVYLIYKYIFDKIRIGNL